MIATLSRQYISDNEQWLGNGDYVMMGISDITQSEQDAADCKGTWNLFFRWSGDCFIEWYFDNDNVVVLLLILEDDLKDNIIK